MKLSHLLSKDIRPKSAIPAVIFFGLLSLAAFVIALLEFNNPDLCASSHKGCDVALWASSVTNMAANLFIAFFDLCLAVLFAYLAASSLKNLKP